MKKVFALTMVLLLTIVGVQAQTQKRMKGSKIKKQELVLTQKWDKTFPKSDKVNHRKVTFVNRYGITLAADLYEPKEYTGKLAAIAVSGPFGSVKEQCSGLYAQTMAERGFLTLAFDPSFTGESGGEPRSMASPDINTEDFQAAVDFLSTQPNVDPERIGIIGICGWGGMAINAAALDTRIKATVAATMYDISRATANGYFDADDSDSSRFERRKKLNAQRNKEYAQGYYEQGGGVVDPLPTNAPQFIVDYHDYYKTQRGYHKRSGNSNDGWTVTGTMSFLNQPILAYSKEIRSAVLVMVGEKAHSRYFGEDAYRNMTTGSSYADNKELLVVPGASHTDLYDGGGKNAIPFDKLETFFKKNLNAGVETPTHK
jgi:fermentation-respiration switch protein FrsA (DUF1100 family)